MASLMSKVTKSPKSLPPRIVFYAAEKFGKTSFAANATSWNPVFVMSSGETGLMTLMETGLVPMVDHFPEDCKTWNELQQCVWALRDDEHSFNCAVFDTGNGCETLCAQAVCDANFDGNWIDYAAFGKGHDLAVKWWDDFLAQLDILRMKRNMAIILLYHSKVKTFNDPAAKDFDQWKPECIEKLWAKTHKWADAIIFGGFNRNLTKGKGQNKEKAVGEERRYLQTEPTGAIVAGTRYGLPAKIEAPPGAKNLWNAFEKALTEARGGEGVMGKKIGTLPNLQEFCEIIGRKGRNYEAFKKWGAAYNEKHKLRTDFAMYGKIPIQIVETYLRLMATLVDAKLDTAAEPESDKGAGSAPQDSAAVESRTPATETIQAPAETKEPDKAPEAPKTAAEAPKPETAPVVETKPEAAAVSTPEAPVTTQTSKPVVAGDAKAAIDERNNLENDVYALADELGYKPRGLMNLHLPKLGYKPRATEHLSELPLDILKKFVEALANQLEVKKSVK